MSKLNESDYTDPFFGFVNMIDTTNGIDLRPPTEILHFNNQNSVTVNLKNTILNIPNFL